MHRSWPLMFINYRESDQPWAAAIIDLVLSGRFGEEAVFFASRSVPPGAAFDKALLSAVRHSGVLLVVVGERWLTAEDGLGKRLIDCRQDWVRREIAAAFSAGTTVVPVLVGETPRLEPQMLPVSIRRLAVCQYVRMRHRDAWQDLNHLLDLLGRLVRAPKQTTHDLNHSA